VFGEAGNLAGVPQFFKGLKGEGPKSGYPKFKRKGERDTARLYEVTLEERHLRMPNVGRVRLKETCTERGFADLLPAAGDAPPALELTGENQVRDRALGLARPRDASEAGSDSARQSPLVSQKHVERRAGTG
jgi:hypothetical protein